MSVLTLGFTGTQEGMSDAQATAIEVWLSTGDLILNAKLRGGVLAVHGDCVGADADFHRICLLCEPMRIRIRPSNHPKRAWCKGADEVMPVRAPLDRNTDIVNDCDILIATPKTYEEELRSGTWATIRRARKAGKPIAIVWPDGKIKREN